MITQREIKFRAWDNVHKCFNSTVAANLLLQLHEEDEDIDHEYGKRFFLMQYTGLKDVDMDEIYEGDIIRLQFESFGKDREYLVVYENACFYLFHHLGLKEIDGSPYKWGPLYRVNELIFQIKIIGNIYENE